MSSARSTRITRGLYQRVPDARTGQERDSVCGASQNPEDTRVRGFAAVVPAAVLVLAAGCALLADQERVGSVAVAGFVLVGVIFAVRAGCAALSRRVPFGTWLLTVQAVLTVALLAMDGWVWHGVSGLLTGALLLMGGWAAGTAVVLTVAVPATAWALALEPGQLLHWLFCHTAVTLLIWALVRLTNLVRAQWRDHREAVQNAREQERAQAALALHDVLGRSLVAITLRGEVVHRSVGEDPELRAEVRSLIDLARQARSEIRTAVATPWRTTLEEELALSRSVLADASVDLLVEAWEEDVPAHAEWVLAAALREAVTNVLVHSRATRVWISSVVEREEVVLRVVNDGAPVRESPVVHGTGLRGVVARCLAVEGRVRVEGPALEVFTLTCRIPVG